MNKLVLGLFLLMNANTFAETHQNIDVITAANFKKIGKHLASELNSNLGDTLKNQYRVNFTLTEDFKNTKPSREDIAKLLGVKSDFEYSDEGTGVVTLSLYNILSLSNNKEIAGLLYLPGNAAPARPKLR